jgi:hypothetical protein
LYNWHPDQSLLEEELGGMGMQVELVLQYQDIDPALVIAGD